jgi:subtilisin family serine protease
VCVLDSGIDRTHEDFVTSDLSGLASVYNWAQDGIGHGTHCSGTIAAADNGRGVIGVAPNATIYMIKVFSNRGNYLYARYALN